MHPCTLQASFVWCLLFLSCLFKVWLLCWFCILWVSINCQTAECDLNPMDTTEGIFLVIFQMWLSSHTSHLLVPQVSKSLNTTLFHLGCSCVHSPLPEWRKVYFSQQVPLPPPFLRPSLRGEEKVPLVWPCWGRRLMRSNKGLYADKDHVVLTETLLNSCWRSIELFSFDCKIQPCTVL